MKFRVISTLPKPFLTEVTPYEEVDFSHRTKSVCSSYLPCLRMGKVIIIGDLGVGKTSLVNRFCRHVYNYNYKATIGVDFEVERFHILDVPFDMQIWDTAGQERFKCIAGAYYRSAHAIITVFDLTSFKSLENCSVWMREALDFNLNEPLKFLVGSKRDLVLNSVYDRMEKEAAQVAGHMGAEYWAVSSRIDDQVTEMFSRVAALCFERIITIDFDSSNGNGPLQIGTKLLDSNRNKKNRKRDIHCEWGSTLCAS